MPGGGKALEKIKDEDAEVDEDDIKSQQEESEEEPTEAGDESEDSSEVDGDTKLASRREMRLHQKALEAEAREVARLQNKGVWDLSTVKPWRQVSREARENGTEVHLGYIFGYVSRKVPNYPKVTLTVSSNIALSTKAIG